MKTLRQLLRQPLKSIAGLLLVALATGLLCANAGQYIAALRTREQVERDYTTAALTTSKYMKQRIPGGGISYLFNQPYEVRMFLSELVEEYPEIVRRVDGLGLISGYCPSVTPFNYVQAPYHGHSGDAYSFIDNKPYATAVLAVTLEEIGPMDERHSSTVKIGDSVIGLGNPEFNISLTAHIDRAVFLQEGFPDPAGRTLRFTVTGGSAEEMEALDLRVGERYLVAGSGYYDNDWDLRCYLVAWNMADSIDAVDWSRITPIDEIEDQELLESIRHLDLLNGEETVAVYGEPVHGNRTCEFLTQGELSDVNASTLYVYLSAAVRYQYKGPDFTYHDISELIAYMETEEYQEAKRISWQEFNEHYPEPGIARLNGTVEEFLASPEGELWNRFMEQESVTNHALPVLTTPRLESVVQFIRGDTVIAQGRSFTEEEYAAGSRVCVLSESLAAVNGLSVGDRIPLSLYTADPNYNEHAIKNANPTADRYSAAQGFAAEEEEYEIVGLYRQTDEWGEDPYAFLPNTVFVPEKAVTAETWAADSGGIFRTLVLRNGAVEAMEAILEEAGYPGLFVYYDQGYTKIAPQLDELLNNVRVSCIAGVTAWAVILLLFLALFPLSQRKTAQRMWALGAQSGHIRRHVLVVGIGLAVPGTVLGGVLGYALLQNALEKTSAESGLALSMEPWTVPALAGAQLLCCVIAIFLCSVFLARIEAWKETR